MPSVHGFTFRSVTSTHTRLVRVSNNRGRTSYGTCESVRSIVIPSPGDVQGRQCIPPETISKPQPIPTSEIIHPLSLRLGIHEAVKSKYRKVTAQKWNCASASAVECLYLRPLSGLGRNCRLCEGAGGFEENGLDSEGRSSQQDGQHRFGIVILLIRGLFQKSCPTWSPMTAILPLLKSYSPESQETRTHHEYRKDQKTVSCE